MGIRYLFSSKENTVHGAGRVVHLYALCAGLIHAESVYAMQEDECESCIYFDAIWNYLRACSILLYIPFSYPFVDWCHPDHISSVRYRDTD